VLPGQLTDKTEAEWQRAFELFNLFDVDKGIVDMTATLAHLREDKACTGKAGSVGYCLGGKIAFLMATRSDSDCNVGYYGVGLDELVGEAAKITKPLMLHIAAKDRFSSPEAQQKVLAALNTNQRVTMHVYDEQDHAFARVGGEHYDEAAAKLADRRTLDFLGRTLGK
jgi:carboxymethylenebutenolidase